MPCVAYRADMAILTDPASGSMPVLGPTGTIARVMAAPTVAGPIGLNLGNPSTRRGSTPGAVS